MDSSSKIRVVVAGANGHLGSKILNYVSQHENVEAVGLVRDLNKVPKLENVSFVQADIQILDDNLRKAVRGAKTVISAVQGGREVIVQGQSNLLKAIEEEHVTKFIPSDFSFNMFALDPKENINIGLRLEFASILAKSQVPQYQHVFNGCFMEVAFGFLGLYNPKEQTVSYYGSDEQLMDFTSYDDTAKFTAELAIDFNVPNGPVHFAGDVLNIKQVASTFEKVRNKKIQLVRKGSTEDLKHLIKSLREKDPSNIYSYLPYMYQLPSFDGRAKLKPQNQMYSQVKTETWEQFLTSNPAGLQIQ